MSTTFAGELRACDAGLALLLGLSDDELRAARPADLVHPEDLPRAASAVAEIRRGGAVSGLELRLRHRDGGYRWLSFHATGTPAADRIDALASDVTLRKQAERRDAEHERVLQMAEEIGHIGWWSMDPRSGAVAWSREVYRILGRDPASFQPTIDSALAAYHPEDRPMVVAARQGAFKRGEPFRVEARVLRPSGEIRWVASYGRAELDGEGKAQRIYGIFQDVTERVQASAEMAKLARVASRTSNAVLIVNGKARIEWVNDAFVQLSGYSHDEARGATPDSLLLGPESSQETVLLLTEQVQRGASWKGELTTYHRSGRPSWVEVEVQPLPDNDDPARYMAILTDITERKKAEADSVRAREAAIEASRVKSQFLANMSHEIRTPMNGVIGSAQLLLSTTLTPEQREYAEAISGAGGVLLALINDVLDISKIEAGKLELEHASFSLPKVVEDTMASFRPLALRKGLSLTAIFADELPLRHIGDPVRVRQIFTNLLGNAVKFTSKGGIGIVVKRNPDGTVYTTVRDTGIGIPTDRRNILFEPFVQADGSTTRNFGGTGLGLAITRELVRKMGGAIWFDSEVGEGTTFHFTLPLTEASGLWDEDEAAPETPRQLPTPLPPARLDILLAEDNPVNALVARRLLERDGHTVTVASNGKAAVEAAREREFDVVLMDVQMPVLDGFEATRQLRELQRPERRRLPIIALTANAMKGDRDRCILAGMDAYLTKPLDPVALRRTVLELGRRGNDLFDRAALLTRVGGDLELGFLVAKTYVESHERLVRHVDGALASGNLDELARAAHGLRGALSTVASSRGVALAQQMERAAQARNLAECTTLAQQLEGIARRLAEELTVWRLSPRATQSGLPAISAAE